MLNNAGTSRTVRAEARTDIWQLRLPEKHSSSWNHWHHQGTGRFSNWRQQGRWPSKTQYHAVYRNVNFAGTRWTDSVLIKTNFSKKQAAFLICLYPWRHLDFTERSGAAPQLPFIATAGWAITDPSQQHIYPTLQLTQLQSQEWTRSCVVFEGFPKGSKQTIKMYNGCSLSGDI